MEIENGAKLDLAAMIEKIRPDVERTLTDEFSKKVAQSLSWGLETEIRDFVSGYIKTHIMPDVQAQLEAQHSEIAMAIVAAVKMSCELLSQKLTEHATTNISRSYNISEIAKRIFQT